MAVHSAHADLTGAPVPDSPPEQVDDSGAVELLGRVVDHPLAGSVLPEDATPEESLHSLRLLALDNLADIVHLRELLAWRDRRIAELEADVECWQERAQTLSTARASEKLAAYRRERELITVLHQTMLENEDLAAELHWRSRPWWRRGARPKAAATPAELLASAAR